MVTYDDYLDSSLAPEDKGTLEINTEYVTTRKPMWLLALKLIGSIAMVAAVYVIALPSLMKFMSLWQAIPLVAGVLLVYQGIAFFIRANPDIDRLYYDDWDCDGDSWTMFGSRRRAWSFSQFLLQLQMIFGPGRFVSETILDLCVEFGFAKGPEVLDPAAQDDKSRLIHDILMQNDPALPTSPALIEQVQAEVAAELSMEERLATDVADLAEEAHAVDPEPSPYNDRDPRVRYEVFSTDRYTSERLREAKDAVPTYSRDPYATPTAEPAPAPRLSPHRFEQW
nr:hypothetical protein [Pirellula staleyi]